MNLPLFFKTCFNRDDGHYNKYSVLAKDVDTYDLFENGVVVANFKSLKLAIDYFEMEFNVENEKIPQG